MGARPLGVPATRQGCAVRLRVDDGEVASGAATAAAAARGAAELARDVGQGGAVHGCVDPVPGREVAAGLAELTDVCRAVLELVALDLDTVSGLMRRSAAIYGAVERGVAASAASGRPGRVGAGEP
jgi:hypothetical protein